MADSAKISFPKLNQSNWGSWKQRMEWLLEKEDLWDVVSTAKPEPVTEEWKNRDRKARANIGLFLDESQYKFIKGAESAKGMWNALKEHHEKATMSTVVHYLNQLCSASLPEGGNIEEHLIGMEELFDKLAAAGETLKESLQIAMILRSLPSSYRSLVQSLQSRADADWTVTLVKTRLLDEYNQRRERDDSLTKDMKAMKLKAFGGGGSAKNEKVCYFCQQPGHFRKQCKKWQAQKGESASGGAVEKRHEHREAKVKPKAKQAQDTSNVVCFMAGDGNSTCWVIDSGATRHMTCDRSFFTELRTEVDSKVTLANGNKTKVGGIGDGVVFGENASGEKVEITLKDVLYVPELDGGLIAVSQLAAKGFVTQFSDTRCDILNASGKTVVVGDKIGNLYQLRLHERSLKAKGDHLERCQHTWHRRVGHRDPDVLQRMASGDLIADILVKDYGLQRDLATEASTTFLTSYRRCPDNPDVPLAQWRIQLWEDALPSGRKHLAAQLYPRWVEYRTRYLAPSPEIISMLQTLRLQYLLGIVTNGPSASQWEKIDRLALGRYFDCILVSSDLPWAKPDRNIFYAACHYLGVQPEECAIIGDKLETDIQGGLESKLATTIWLPLPKDLRLMHDKSLADLDDHIRPDYIVENVLDLPAVLPLTTSFCQQRRRPVVERRGSNSYTPKTTRNREASYNRFLPDVPDLYSSSSNSCDSNGTLESH